MAQDTKSPCDRYGEYPVVFVGTAGKPVPHTFVAAADVPPHTMVMTPMSIERVYRGVDIPAVYLSIDALPDPLAPGRRYLVYAGKSYGNARDAFDAVIVQPVEEAQTDLEFLERAALGDSTAFIYGKLSAAQMIRDRRVATALAGAVIRFVSRDSTTETVTDANGEFALGEIVGQVERIEAFVTDDWWIPPRGAIARRGGCERVDLIAILNGRIRGRLTLSNGTPWPGSVTLERIDHPRQELRPGFPSAKANEHGFFEFAGVQPGRYLVGVKFGRTGEPSATSYYPGVTNRDDAIPIVVGPATVHEGVDVIVDDGAHSKGELEVRVDGARGGGDIAVCLSVAGTNAPEQHSQAGPNRPVVVSVRDGASYELFAHVDWTGGHSESTLVKVTGTANRQTIRLRAERAPLHHESSWFDCNAVFNRRQP